ncbi:MAG: polysaccharide deacetylase family protein [Clostridia bacterium]|nr:polysaccharide deacetylase family protein [Clostridia bacterium]
MKIFYFKLKKRHLLNLILIIFLIILVLLLFCKTPVEVFNDLLKNPIYKGKEDQPKIAFACNVVWGTEYMPGMLDVFKDHNVKITFFIGGEWAEDNPKLLKEIVQQGHEIGNHGYSHKKHSQLTKEQNIQEIVKTEEIIKKIIGSNVDLFAPPYGDYDKQTVQIADMLGYKTIMWSIDTIDWKREGKDIIIDRVLKNPHNGAIVLMHPTQYTVEALPAIIEGLDKKGFKVVKVSDIID